MLWYGDCSAADRKALQDETLMNAEVVSACCLNSAVLTVSYHGHSLLYLMRRCASPKEHIKYLLSYHNIKYIMLQHNIILPKCMKVKVIWLWTKWDSAWKQCLCDTRLSSWLYLQLYRNIHGLYSFCYCSFLNVNYIYYCQIAAVCDQPPYSLCHIPHHKGYFNNKSILSVKICLTIWVIGNLFGWLMWPLTRNKHIHCSANYL